MKDQNLHARQRQKQSFHSLKPLLPEAFQQQQFYLDWQVAATAWRQGWGAAFLDQPLRSFGWAALHQTIRDRYQLYQLFYRLCCIQQAKQGLAALTETQQELCALAEQTEFAIFLYQNERLRYVNPITETMSGYTREELMTMDIWDLIDPTTLPRLCRLKRQQKLVFLHHELELLTKDGEERSLDIIVTSITFEGRPAMLGTALDMTALRDRSPNLVHSI